MRIESIKYDDIIVVICSIQKGKIALKFTEIRCGKCKEIIIPLLIQGKFKAKKSSKVLCTTWICRCLRYGMLERTQTLSRRETNTYLQSVSKNVKWTWFHFMGVCLFLSIVLQLPLHNEYRTSCRSCGAHMKKIARLCVSSTQEILYYFRLAFVLSSSGFRRCYWYRAVTFFVLSVCARISTSLYWNKNTSFNPSCTTSKVIRCLFLHNNIYLALDKSKSNC